MTQDEISLALKALLDPLVSSRVYINEFPQEPAIPVWPSIRYTYVSITPSVDLCGDGGEETADYRIQIDVVAEFSKGPSAFSDLVKAVKAEMKTLRPEFVWDGGQYFFDGTTKTNRQQLDYLAYLSSDD